MNSSSDIILRLSWRHIVGVLLLGALLWLVSHERTVLLVIFSAVLLTVAIQPAVTQLVHRHVPRSLAIGLVYLLILLLFLTLIGLVIPIITAEAAALATQGPTLANRAVDALSALFPANSVDRLLNSLDLQVITGQALSQTGLLLSSATGIILTVGQTIALALIALALAYFMLSDAALASRFIRRMIPPVYRPRAQRVGDSLSRQLGRWVRAQFFISLYYGAAFGIALTALRVPYALTLAFVGACLAFIPYLGGIITMGLAMVVAFTTSPIKALWVLIIHVIVATIEGHWLAPTLFGNQLGLHPLAVLLALFLGAELIGLPGALFAVPILVILEVLFDEFYPMVA